MQDDIANLVNISRKIGGHPTFAQGGGGNISVKIDDSLMAIKASGYRLKDMQENDGFAFVHYRDIHQHIKNDALANATEDEFDNFVKAKTAQIDGYPLLKPSIETGFHALLPYKYVIHTHSVYANILCCSQEGKETARTLLPNAIWVDYANPGKNITMSISKAISEAASDIILMQNHGLIICGNNADATLRLHASVNDKIIAHFNIKPDYKLPTISSEADTAKERVIFPDQIVYLLSEDLSNTPAGLETAYAYDYIMQTISMLGLVPNFIAQTDIDYIENMESEKYRKSLMKK